MVKKPNKWIAAALGFLTQPLAFLYVGQLRWAGIYFLTYLLVVVVFVLSTFYFYQIAIVFALMPALLSATCAVHAYRLAARYPEGKVRPGYSRWYGLLGAAFGFFLIIFAIRSFLFEPFRFPSGSMLPTIKRGAILIAQKWGYGNYGTYGIPLLHTEISASLHRGDIIVFEYPLDRSLNYAKRLIGLPGDTITYRGKQLSINGVAVPRSPNGNFEYSPSASTPMFVESLTDAEYLILIEEKAPARIPTPVAFPFREKCSYDAQGVSCEVPAGHYFTLGDNRDNSADSRIWGFVPADHIVGKVVRIIF